ncbi:MAG: hypothetical protein CMB45_05385 [Euryarchaeota archaeon]|nr:hypothetical protein [Euryarchaeota archaeon]MBK38406.1 hypothetical protein [Euryarchaeota archaeon]|tara:strand:- start:15676 stop:16164 length:489 start_codon:yes stop_codon:yes gene_type:complete
MDPYYAHQHTFGPSPEGDLFGIGWHDGRGQGMNPYYPHQHTFGPSPEGDLFGIGNKPSSLKDLRPIKMIDVLRSKDVKLWGIGNSMTSPFKLPNIPPGVQTNITRPAAAKVEEQLTIGLIIGGLAINYALGRYIAAPLIANMTGEKLSKRVRNGIGIMAMMV